MLNVDKLAVELNKLIDVRVAERLKTYTVWKERYESLKEQLQQLHTEAQDLYDNMQQEGLSAGLIEAEGYLRAAKRVEHLIEMTEETYDLENSNGQS